MDIDIIIPTYKPGSYLYDCLVSINSQNFFIDRYQVTIVLNGPKQPYFDQISHWLSSFEFNSCLLYSDVASVSSARNLALDKTSSNYVCFLDDDDLISENYLSNLIGLAKPGCIVVANTYNFLDDKNILTNDYLTFNESFVSNNLLKFRKYLSNSCCKLIPRALIKDRRFNNHLSKSEDAVFMFELSKDISNIISTKPTTIYYRRLRENSATRTKTKLIYELGGAVKIIFYFSMIYIEKPLQYSFLLYCSRLLAVLKRVILTLKG